MGKRELFLEAALAAFPHYLTRCKLGDAGDATRLACEAAKVFVDGALSTAPRAPAAKRAPAKPAAKKGGK